ncbi:hypothetical protein V6N13_064585 [Hibiscus sabdariffa]
MKQQRSETKVCCNSSIMTTSCTSLDTQTMFKTTLGISTWESQTKRALPVKDLNFTKPKGLFVGEGGSVIFWIKCNGYGDDSNRDVVGEAMVHCCELVMVSRGGCEGVYVSSEGVGWCRRVNDSRLGSCFGFWVESRRIEDEGCLAMEANNGNGS